MRSGPGCFLEATKLVPLLTKGDENQPAFHLVVPSLPNFGFSQGVKKVFTTASGLPTGTNTKQKGFGLAQYAEAMHGVMLALGYDEYGTVHSRQRTPNNNIAQSPRAATGAASSPESWSSATHSMSKPHISTSSP